MQLFDFFHISHNFMSFLKSEYNLFSFILRTKWSWRSLTRVWIYDIIFWSVVV